ncbi:hypothetical protein PX699_16040 [Sphingobium sp. H39-3-25]|uniref:hypothetical protein n=1 Tax=Sphingobium arseniciresistens TaxID=3030834 RepID=UPI0023B894B8|nr:hypothetical protein [Sphingobium arseniciresistens]
MSKTGQKLESRPPGTAGCGTEPTDAIDGLRDDPEIRRVLALVLIRQAMKALDQAGEDMACCHLQAAIDSLLERYVGAVPPETN